VNTFFINPKQLDVREEIISTDKIEEKDEDFLIAFFSDLCFGYLINLDFAERIVDQINVFQPDVIVFGGNLIDPEYQKELTSDEIDRLSTILGKLDAEYGIYGVMGEYDLEMEEIITQIYEMADIHLLRNENKLFPIGRNDTLNLIGIDPMNKGIPDLASAFNGVNSSSYLFAFSHCPDIYDALSSYDFDYLVCGHSRGGQIYLPVINYFSRDYGCEKYYHGKKIRNGKTLDISNGTGRIGKNGRLLADAEIVLYTIQAK